LLLRWRFLIPLTLALDSLSLPGLASDGVLEINQSCATAGGCFPGDTAGFPVTISQSGSYRLTGNLAVPSNTTAIQINAVSVTLDLGGFIVSGPNACTGYPTTDCPVKYGNDGIISQQFLVVVRNGSVTGMGGDGILLAGASSEVDHVRVLSCGGQGIAVSGAGRVTNSFSGGNYLDGIRLEDGGQVEGNESRANGGSGVTTFGDRLGSAIVGNRVFDNNVNGIAPASVPGVLVSRNIVWSNRVSQITLAGVFSLGDNLCNGTRC
jgi:parallel beta helix pectate lyase-like protein